MIPPGMMPPDKEAEIIQNLNDLLKFGIYPYNYHVEKCERGLPWVRLRSYSDCSWAGEQQECRDFDAEALRVSFEKNQGTKIPEDYLINLSKFVQTAGPSYWITSE